MEKENFENMTQEELKIRKEKLEKDIESQREMIKSIQSRNPYSGDLSFDYYQLHEMEKELEELNSYIK